MINEMSTVEWERACSALASLVREEFPTTYSLAEIAKKWAPGVTSEQVEALAKLEGQPK